MTEVRQTTANSRGGGWYRKQRQSRGLNTAVLRTPCRWWVAGVKPTVYPIRFLFSRTRLPESNKETSSSSRIKDSPSILRKVERNYWVKYEGDEPKYPNPTDTFVAVHLNRRSYRSSARNPTDKPIKSVGKISHRRETKHSGTDKDPSR